MGKAKSLSGAGKPVAERGKDHSHVRPPARRITVRFGAAAPRALGPPCAKANRQSQRRLPQKLRRFFRRHWIDVEPLRPIRSPPLGLVWNDF